MSEIPTENGKNSETPTRDETNGRFLPGNPGGPGRPQGSISIMGRIKQKFEEDPELFESYIAEVLVDPKLRAEIIRQIDGSPRQNVDVTSGGDRIQVNLVNFSDADHSNSPQL